jgi:DNA-binding IclR family transcriptional regulator
MNADAPLKPTVRILRLIQLLARNAGDGLRPGQIATALNLTPAMVTRDMHDLEGEGFAERVPGRPQAWRLGPEAMRAFRNHFVEIDRAQARLAEFHQRATRIK